jgi:hypothetical protein
MKSHCYKFGRNFEIVEKPGNFKIHPIQFLTSGIYPVQFLKFRNNNFLQIYRIISLRPTLELLILEPPNLHKIIDLGAEMVLGQLITAFLRAEEGVVNPRKYTIAIPIPTM